MLAELAVDRRRPGHELKSHAIVDHREAARRERQALTVGAGDVIAAGGADVSPAGLRRDLFRCARQFASPEGVDQSGVERDALAALLGQTASDQVLGPSIQRVPDFGAEPGAGERGRVTRDGLAGRSPMTSLTVNGFS